MKPSRKMRMNNFVFANELANAIIVFFDNMRDMLDMFFFIIIVLLPENDCTAHSMFKISFEVNKASIYTMNKNSEYATFLCEAALIMRPPSLTYS